MKRYWWHCTQDNHGDVLSVARRPPLIRGPKEPITPRLCVSNSIPGCFAAVLFDKPGPVYCYRTAEKRTAIAARNVWDAVITGESWLIPPMSLVLDRCILPNVAKAATEFTTFYHDQTGASSSCAMKVCQFAIACRALDAGPYWMQRAETMLKIWEIVDPEAEIFRLTEKYYRTKRAKR